MELCYDYDPYARKDDSYIKSSLSWTSSARFQISQEKSVE